MCFYGVDSSGKEKGKTSSDAIDAMPESLPQSLNVSASIDPKSANCLSIRLRKCKNCISNLSNVPL